MVDTVSVLFIGCGDIASRCALQLPAAYHSSGIRRRQHLIPSHISAYYGDCLLPESLLQLEFDGFDYVVITFTPSGRSEADYYEAYVRASDNLSQWLHSLNKQPKRIFFISSTSVYQQTNHEWLDENSAVTDSGTGGQLVAAEQLWLNHWPTTVLRLSGIYGDNRRFFLNKVISGAQAPAEPHYSNRIHIDDAAAAIAYLIDYHQRGERLDSLYIVSDKEPVLLSEVVTWIESRLTVSANSHTEVLARRGGSKRCSSLRLQQLGFEFTFPSYREGYGAMLEQAL